jgi:hypothetical protein
MQAEMISTISKVQMLSHSLPQIATLPHVHTQTLVNAEDAVEVNGTSSLKPQVAANMFQSVER